MGSGPRLNGVTTDGTFRPARPAWTPWRTVVAFGLVSLLHRMLDLPRLDSVLSEGLPWNWESYPDYLDALSKRRFDIDVASQLPHASRSS